MGKFSNPPRLHLIFFIYIYFFYYIQIIYFIKINKNIMNFYKLFIKKHSLFFEEILIIIIIYIKA